jgi:lysyl-tRNA synthetase class 2
MNREESPGDSDWAPSASWSVVQQRARLLRDLRTFFDQREFVEIETPVLSRDTVVDRHLEPIPVDENARAERPVSSEFRWLQTSPEFGMKRAVAHYQQSVYQITRAFRLGETGRLHNPEFTILEWYQTPANYEDGMQLLSDLAAAVLDCVPAQRRTYRDAFVEYTGLDPHSSTSAELRQFACHAAGTVQPPADPGAAPDFGDDCDGWLDWLLSEWVQPRLGEGAPTILCDYPATQAALAKVDPGPPPVAQRFELYVDGIELANGYHELDDAEQLARRAADENRLRGMDGRPRLPESSRLIDAMADGFPPCAGVAMGVDRLLMVKLGLDHIDQVLTFPDDRA